MAKSNTGIRGVAHLALYDENGNLKLEIVKHNLITTAGDQYYAESGVNGIAGFSRTKAVPTGMKLGNASTNAPAKSSASGADLDSYISGSNVLFDTNASSVSAVGSDTGYKIRYTCTWNAGVATDTNIVEAAIVNDASTNATSTVANTYARVTFTAINKGASDTLVLNWDHVFFDAP